VDVVVARIKSELAGAGFAVGAAVGTSVAGAAVGVGTAAGAQPESAITKINSNPNSKDRRDFMFPSPFK
jgi:hypothetical protein